MQALCPSLLEIEVAPMYQACQRLSLIRQVGSSSSKAPSDVELSYFAGDGVPGNLESIIMGGCIDTSGLDELLAPEVRLNPAAAQPGRVFFCKGRRAEALAA